MDEVVSVQIVLRHQTFSLHSSLAVEIEGYGKDRVWTIEDKRHYEYFRVTKFPLTLLTYTFWWQSSKDSIILYSMWPYEFSVLR